jgi:hypothetical protein
MTEIKSGQKWRDKDRRREAEGNIRTFEVTKVDPCGNYVECKRVDTGKQFTFGRRRFGSDRANDSLVMVEGRN